MLELGDAARGRAGPGGGRRQPGARRARGGPPRSGAHGGAAPGPPRGPETIGVTRSPPTSSTTSARAWPAMARPGRTAVEMEAAAVLTSATARACAERACSRSRICSRRRSPGTRPSGSGSTARSSTRPACCWDAMAAQAVSRLRASPASRRIALTVRRSWPRAGLALGRQRVAQRGDVGGDRRQLASSAVDPADARRGGDAGGSARCRSSESSMPSSRCETDRSRRVSRSTSAAEGSRGLPSRPPGRARRSHAPRARAATAALTTGFATISSAISAEGLLALSRKTSNPRTRLRCHPVPSTAGRAVDRARIRRRRPG